MRKKIHPNIRVGFIALSITFFVLLILSIFGTTVVLADTDDQLTIYVTDEDKNEISEIYEGEYFIVSVYVRGELGKPIFLTDLEITFDEKPYQITDQEDPVRIIEASAVDSDTTFTITASKEGYISGELSLEILDSVSSLPKLIVTLEKYTVNVDEDFSVVVTVVDENEIEKPVENVAVSILNSFEKEYTDSNGRVWLTAPDSPGQFKIQAQKDGVYTIGQASIKVNDIAHWWEIIYDSYFQIALAIACLAFAIVFVNIRSRKNIYGRSKEITNEKMINKYTPKDDIATKLNDKKEEINLQGFSGAPVRSQPKKDPRVEEIRISRLKKEKEIVKVETQGDKADKVVSEKRIKRKDYDWFEGTDDMRYEIDKMTGEVDEEGLDKWFEGVSDLKVKIDEKIKKKDKKKNGEKEES